MDRYVYMYFATGITSYFWGFPLYVVVFFSTITQLFESSKWGKDKINKYLHFWPVRNIELTFTNILLHVLAAIIGWLSVAVLFKIIYLWELRNKSINVIKPKT